MRSSHALLVLLSSLLAAAAASKQCHADDKAALLAVAMAFGNKFPSWMPSTPCCDWDGIHCDASTGRVDELAVNQDDDLTGTVPAAIAGLTHLRSLRLHHLPALSGPIPLALAGLSNLFDLTISWTGVSGPVPSFVGTLTKLGILDLSFNSLTGAIPPSLAELPNLYGIDLSRNRLTDTIPPSLFSKMAAQQEAYLTLSHNNLSGSIPAEFAAVPFARIDLSRNHITGDASMLFGRAKPTQSIDLSRNALEFDLSGVELPEQLFSVDVSHNMIFGGIPAVVADLANLQYFNVSYNRLCGEVPSGGSMARFDLYCFQHNKCLCGAPLAPCHRLLSEIASNNSRGEMGIKMRPATRKTSSVSTSSRKCL